MSYQTWKSYTKIIPNTAEEREEIAREREELNAEINAERDTQVLSWKASNGQLIEVFPDLSFSMNGSMYYGGSIVAVPAAQAAKYASAGIVAVLKSDLGMKIGLTAERKAVLANL